MCVVDFNQSQGITLPANPSFQPITTRLFDNVTDNAIVYSIWKHNMMMASEEAGDAAVQESAERSPSFVLNQSNPSNQNFRERLNAFFWTHSPQRVAQVDALLAQKVGQEELLIQRLYAQYGARDFSGHKAIDDIYEHERYSYLTFSWGASYPGHLLITDRKRWSNRRGTPSSQKKEEVEPQLPANWHWTSDWEIDRQHDTCDDQGWSYALDFPMLNTLQQTKSSRKRPLATDHVRRRRWIRTRERNQLDPSLSVTDPSTLAPTSESNSAGHRRQEPLASASSLASSSKGSESGEPSEVELGDDQGDYDDVSLEDATLKLHSLSMDPAAVDAAWRGVVNKLEACYVETKNHHDKRKREGKLTKEKLRHQIRSLEKTLSSLHDLAKQQQHQQPGNGTDHTTASGSSSSSSSSSYTSSSSLGATPSPQEIAFRIANAQIKLDALKRLLWFPRTSKYTLRFSIDGIFYGCRDFYMETLKAHFGVQLCHVQNPVMSDGLAAPSTISSIVPVCRLDMTGHLVVCGKHCKVLGDKGTRVPKSVWDRMYMESDFIMHFELVYVVDGSPAPSTPSNPSSIDSFANGRWEFVEKADANRVELHNFTRKVNGGMDLPEAMVRNLMQQVLSGFAREWTLLYLPWEIAYCFRAPPTRLDLTGTIQMDGPKVDTVMEKPLEYTALPDDLGSTNQTDQQIREPEMFAMVNLLGLTYQQLNLLVALQECRLFPSKFSFRSLSSLCDYHRAFVMNQPSRTVTKLFNAWQEAIELLYIRKCQEQQQERTSSSSSKWHKVTSRRKRVSKHGFSLASVSCSEHPEYELFDIHTLFERVAWLGQKPVNAVVQVNRFQTTLNVMSLVDACEKLYERIVYGREPVVTRSTASSNAYMYGIRIGRKPRRLLSNCSSSDSVTLMGSPQESLSQLQTTRVFGAIKSALALLKQHLEFATSEVSGRLRGNGNDCQVVLELEDMHLIAKNSMQFLLQPLPVEILEAFRVEAMMVSSTPRVGQEEHQEPNKAGAALQLRISLVEEQSALLTAVLGSLSTEMVVDVERLLKHAGGAGECLTKLQAVSCGFVGNPQPMVSEPEQTASFHEDPSTPFAYFRCSEFTKFMTRASDGRLSMALVPWIQFVARQVGLLIQTHCPEHSQLFDTCQRHIIEGLACEKLEMQFHLLCSMLQHDQQRANSNQTADDLFVSICGAAATAAVAAGSAPPSSDHPSTASNCEATSNMPPLVYRNEWKLLKMAMDVDDLFMRWIDGRYPGHFSDPSCL